MSYLYPCSAPETFVSRIAKIIRDDDPDVLFLYETGPEAEVNPRSLRYFLGSGTGVISLYSYAAFEKLWDKSPQNTYDAVHLLPEYSTKYVVTGNCRQ